MRDSCTIEAMSVSYVKDTIIKCPRLAQYISENDKEPSWDGHILIYSKPQKTKDNIKGPVLTQVKGLECTSISSSDISYPVEIADMRNYLNNGGVIFFVVQIDDSDNRAIFYETLLPIKIKSYIESINEGQKAKSIQLKPFPIDDKNAIETIFYNFYEDSHKQNSFSSSNLLSLEDLKGNPNVETITISTHKFGHSDNGNGDSLNPFFENELCGYVKFKGSSTPEPIKNIIKSVAFSIKKNEPISINGKQYFDHYTELHSRQGIVYVFGGGFKLSTISQNSASFHYDCPKLLSRRLTCMEFLVDLFQSMNFSLGERNYSMGTFTEGSMKDAEEHLNFCKSVKLLLDTLHINEDLDISLLNENDAKNLALLHDSIVEHKPVDNLLLENDGPTPTNLKVGNLTIKLLLSHSQEEPSRYDIEDFFNLRKWCITYTREGSEGIFIYPSVASLSSDEYGKISNVDWDSILPTLEILFKDNPHIAYIANNCLNSLITAYDQSGRKQALSCAKDIAVWLLDKELYGVTYAAKQLDLLQIAKRERNLSKVEKEQALDLIEDSSSTAFDKAGLYLVLGNRSIAKRQYALLTDKDKEIFDNSPIHKFWK